MSISNIIYVNRRKFYSFNIEHKGVTYQLYMIEQYHKDSNWKRTIDVMGDTGELERNPIFPELEKIVMDNLDSILETGKVTK